MDIDNIAISDWDELFFRHVYLISSKSKDNRTKIGAVAVKEKRIIASGYNGICEGLDDTKPERYRKPFKKFFFEHGERNMIFMAARFGITISGATCYTNSMPCCDCARAIIQSNISELVLHQQHTNAMKQAPRNKWVKWAKYSEQMLKEKKISIRYFDKYLGVKTLFDGRLITV